MEIKNRFIRIVSSLTLWHVLFWSANVILFATPFLLNYYQAGETAYNKLLPGLIYIGYLALVVYLNYFLFIPRFAARKMVGMYFFILAVSVTIIALLFLITFRAVIHVNPDTITIVSFASLEIIYVIITSFFKFFKEWIENQGLQLQIKEVEKQKVEAELNALKAQLNPHFLFNVLNSIYSHSLHKSEHTPTIVLKLSELMSYILYDCRSEYVPVNKEVEFLKTYIELEKIRMEEEMEIKFSTDNLDHVKIPPLLFMPFIDNAFKHGMSSQPKKKQIHIDMAVDHEGLVFCIRNTKGSSPGRSNSQTSGIGIENARKRLELLYPDKYSLTIEDRNSEFIVEMRITHKFYQL